MTDSNEQSYYEIALTNRQAIFFFVFLLVFVLLVFLSGVWVGRSGQKELLEKARLEAAASQIELAGIPEVQVGPGSRTAEEPASPPDLSSLEPRKTGPTTLAQDVGAAGTPPDASGGGEETVPEPATDPPASSSAPPPAGTEPATAAPPVPQPELARIEPARPTPAEASRPEPAAASGSFVIQVFSTKDEAQAKKVLSDLKGASFKAFLSPVKVGSSTMYRVRIGPFERRDQADQTAVKVKEKFKRFETWVTAASN